MIESLNKNLMASFWTPAAKVRRKFKAGRQRRTDLVYDSERAILEARIVLLEIRREMLEAGIKTTGEDVNVGLILMSPEGAESDHVFVWPMPRKLEGIAALSTKIARCLDGTVVPVGVAIWLRDREAGDADVWVQPWLVNARAARAAIVAQKAFKDSKGSATNKPF